MRKAFVFLLVLTLSLPLAFSRENFIVDDYHVDVIVSDDSSSRFNEFLKLDFITPSHGIYRDIQYKFSPENFINLEAEISNIMTNTETSLTYSGDFISLRMGDPNSYVYGPVEYRIAYDFLLEDDGNREYDEWYVNLLSAAWDTDVKHFSFSVTFPHAVDPERVYLTYGPYGSSASIKPEISADGRTIYAEFENLGPYNAVTLRCEFDEGYFSTKPLKANFGNIFNSVAAILALFVIAYIFYSYFTLGRDKEIIAPVVFNPPEGFSSLDVGYIIDNTITFEKDILSMIFYFADKGYLRIEEKDNDDFLFTKLKDIEEDRPSYERKLFSMIFSNSDSVDVEALAKRNFAQNSVYKIRSEIERYYEKNRPLFEPKSIRRSSLLRALGLIAVILFSVLASINNIGELTLFILFPSLFAFAFLTLLGHRYFANSAVSSKALKVFQIILSVFALIFTGMFIFAALATSTRSYVFALILTIINAALIFSASFFSYAVNKRSEWADEMLSKIIGYKEFLETVELDKLKLLIEDDPEYYYHNLSYAIALNLEENYSSKFKSLSMSTPSWYSSRSSVFTSYMIWHSFSHSWRRGYDSHMAAINPPSGYRGGSRSHRGSSGFSGGGFSGGGGRSW